MDWLGYAVAGLVGAALAVGSLAAVVAYLARRGIVTIATTTRGGGPCQANEKQQFRDHARAILRSEDGTHTRVTESREERAS